MRYLEPLAHIALLLAALLACGKDKASTGTKPAAALVDVRAEDLSRDYRVGAAAGGAKWDAKPIRVTGIGGYFESCKTILLDAPCIRLDGLVDETSGLPFVNCALKDPTKGIRIAHGSKVTLTGVVRGVNEAPGDGSVLHVLVEDCEIVSSTPPAAPQQPRPSPAPRSVPAHPVKKR